MASRRAEAQDERRIREVAVHTSSRTSDEKQRSEAAPKRSVEEGNTMGRRRGNGATWGERLESSNAERRDEQKSGRAEGKESPRAYSQRSRRAERRIGRR